MNNNSISILEEISRGGYEASLITTYNAYIPFYEEVVLPKLMRSGVRHNVLMMDARQCVASISQSIPRASGRLYSLLPMRGQGGVFHPKVIFLVGISKGLLLIGSHNLTLAGWGYNREIGNVIQMQSGRDSAGIALMNHAWEQISGWLKHKGHHLPDFLWEMAVKVSTFAPWIVPEENQKREQNNILLSTQPDEVCLWEKLVKEIEAPVKRIIILGAFFDRQLQFIRRIRKDINPEEIIIGVDPKTVVIPGKMRPIEGVRWVNAQQLWTGAHNYLHAKCMVIETIENVTYLISGSANPSSPAWLQEGLSGNVEIMLMRKGDDAAQSAIALGLLNLAEKPGLNNRDRLILAANEPNVADREGVDGLGSLGIAHIDEQGIQWASKKIIYDTVEFVDAQNEVLESVEVDGKGEEEVSLAVSEQVKSRTCLVRCLRKGKHIMTLLVHHKQQIEEQARTTIQRRFRDALVTLESDSPDISTFLQCAERMIFDNDVEIRPSDVKDSRSNRTGEKPASRKPSLISRASNSRRKRKYRLRPSSDNIGYLLDWLVYQLGLYDHAQSREDLDAKGRNEEEQRETEDEETEEILAPDRKKTVDPDEILTICHKKVHRLVDRMVKQLVAYVKDEVELSDIVVRLTAVLALLRELRKCDGKKWVRRGQTIVPMDEEYLLLEASARALCEGGKSLINVEHHNQEVIDGDELSRLKGLLLWLAWDCEVAYKPDAPIDEEQHDLQDRFYDNALILALSQIMGYDTDVEHEAQESIKPFAGNGDKWLKDVWMIRDGLFQHTDERFWEKATSVSPGDIATHVDIPGFGYKLVNGTDVGKVYMVSLSRNDHQLKYLGNKIRVLSKDLLFDRTARSREARPAGTG
jgi:hypothetical protein